jgi:hypothetical protein
MSKKHAEERLVLDLRAFRQSHRHLNPALLMEHARVALSWHHHSPINVEVIAGSRRVVTSSSACPISVQ